MQIGQVAEERDAVPQEDTESQDLISSKCGAKHKLLWFCSAEAELYAFVRASAATMGLISMYEDFGTHMNGVLLGDASAALAIVARRGLGKLRHLDTNYLWIQEKAAKGDLNFKKVAGVDNGADLVTKTLSTSVHGQKESIFLEYCEKWVLPAIETWQRRLEQTRAVERDAQL